MHPLWPEPVPYMPAPHAEHAADDEVWPVRIENWPAAQRPGHVDAARPDALE